MRSGSLWLLGPPNSSYLIPPPFCLERSRVPPFGGGASNHFIETSYPLCSLLFFGSSTFLSCFLFPPFPLLRETLPDLHTRPPSQKLNGCCFGCCCCWKNWTIHSLPVLEQQQIFQKNLSSPLFPPRQTRSTIGGGGVGAVWRQTSRCGNRCFPSLLSKAFCWTFHWFYSFYLASFE